MDSENECLEALTLVSIEGTNELCLHRDKCIIDLHPFFEHFFEETDRRRGKPGFERITLIKEDNTAIYRFTLVDFLEAFLGDYSPDDIADFIGKHSMYDHQLEKLSTWIRSAESDYRFCLQGSLTDWNLRRGEALSLHPINFDVAELNSLIPQRYISRYFTEHKFEQFIRGPRKDLAGTKFECSLPLAYSFFPDIRAKLLDADPPIIILRHQNGPDLEYFSMIKYFELPTDHLKLVRK